MLYKYSIKLFLILTLGSIFFLGMCPAFTHASAAGVKSALSSHQSKLDELKKLFDGQQIPRTGEFPTSPPSKVFGYPLSGPIPVQRIEAPTESLRVSHAVGVALDKRSKEDSIKTLSELAEKIAKGGYQREQAAWVIRLPDQQRLLYNGHHRLHVMKDILKQPTMPILEIPFEALPKEAQWFTMGFLNRQGQSALAESLQRHLLSGHPELVKAPLTKPDVFKRQGTASVPREQFKEYLGSYELATPAGAAQKISVRSDKEGLLLRLYQDPSLVSFQDFPALKLKSRGGDHFYSEKPKLELSFTKNAEGKVRQLIVHQGGFDKVAQKLPDVSMLP